MLQAEEIERSFAKLPHYGGYGIGYIDPPWPFRTRSEKGKGRSPEKHYPVMTINQIKELPIRSLIGKDGVIAMWVPSPLVAIGTHVEVFHAWNARPSSLGWCWAKTKRNEGDALFLSGKNSFHMGLGYSTRKNVELCFIGIIGKPPRLARNVRELIISPVREHSRKPDIVRDELQRLYPGPRVEIFARERFAGWDAWGNEIDKFKK